MGIIITERDLYAEWIREKIKEYCIEHPDKIFTLKEFLDWIKEKNKDAKN